MMYYYIHNFVEISGTLLMPKKSCPNLMGGVGTPILSWTSFTPWNEHFFPSSSSESLPVRLGATQPSSPKILATALSSPLPPPWPPTAASPSPSLSLSPPPRSRVSSLDPFHLSSDAGGWGVAKSCVGMRPQLGPNTPPLMVGFYHLVTELV